MSLLELRWDLRCDITLINYTIDGSEIRHFTPDEVGNEYPQTFASAFCTCEIVNAGFLNYQQYHQEIQVAKMKEVPLVIVLRGRGFPDRFWRCFFLH